MKQNHQECRLNIKIAFLTGVDKSEIIELITREGYNITAVIFPYKSKREERLLPVIDICNQLGIVIHRPRRTELYNCLREIEPTLLLSMGYPYLLSADHLSVARLNCNVHPSLLPKYRGPAASWYIIASGEPESGVTAHIIDEGMDTGPILIKRSFLLTPFDNVNSHRRKADEKEKPLVIELLSKIKNDDLTFSTQNESEASVFPNLRTSNDSLLDAQKPLIELYDFIRACDPDRFPAFFIIDGERVYIKVFRKDRISGEEDMV